MQLLRSDYLQCENSGGWAKKTRPQGTWRDEGYANDEWLPAREERLLTWENEITIEYVSNHIHGNLEINEEAMNNSH